MDTLAACARAKVSEMAARDLSKVIGHGTMEVIRRAIARKNGAVLMRMYKTKLINDACDTIKYMSWGEEKTFCRNLRQNTDGDVKDLLSFNYEKETCSNPVTGIFDIPATVRRGGEQVQKGTLDLTRLMDKTQSRMFTTFQ